MLLWKENRRRNSRLLNNSQEIIIFQLAFSDFCYCCLNVYLLFFRHPRASNLSSFLDLSAVLNVFNVFHVKNNLPALSVVFFSFLRLCGICLTYFYYFFAFIYSLKLILLLSVFCFRSLRWDFEFIWMSAEREPRRSSDFIFICTFLCVQEHTEGM